MHFLFGRVHNATVHAIGVCKLWAVQRDAFIAAAGLDGPSSAGTLCIKVLGATPGCCGFSEAVVLCHCIDQGVTDFWRGR